jgi:glyoxylase-like metal-dependent hydrolase (beta-lactamase superfamily II)/rhodanese-related sulfurtransferase
MIFRQMFDSVSSTYTYVMASRVGGEALIIDPVFEKTDQYLTLLEQLDLKLVKVIDTHVHADHITAMGSLRDKTNCITVMGEQAPVDVVSMRVSDGETINIDGIKLTAMYTPGHTSDSYCFHDEGRIFTGDTLLIKGTGRTDFQNGDAELQYDSLFNKVLNLPEQTLVYPGHDYKGHTVSTLGEEKAFNPRLQVTSKAEYVEIMNNLNLPNPKMMDVAVPENMKMGLRLEKQRQVPSLDVASLLSQGQDNFYIVDLREDNERAKSGFIPSAHHLPYSGLDRHLDALKNTDTPIVFYCAVGERSAMAVSIALASGVKNVMHLVGGFEAYKDVTNPFFTTATS